MKLTKDRKKTILLGLYHLCVDLHNCGYDDGDKLRSDINEYERSSDAGEREFLEILDKATETRKKVESDIRYGFF